MLFGEYNMLSPEMMETILKEEHKIIPILLGQIGNFVINYWADQNTPILSDVVVPYYTYKSYPDRVGKKVVDELIHYGWKGSFWGKDDSGGLVIFVSKTPRRGY